MTQVAQSAVIAGAAAIRAEGRVHTPAQAAEALRRGAHTVVVGTAITHPASITGWFVDALSAG